MKKLAYTLAEALIALAVIGVIAGITLPMMNKFMPDGNKALYLKTYDSLIEATQDLVTNTELYPIVNGDEDLIIYKNFPLYNTVSKTVDGVTYSGNAKYCQLLASAFGSPSEQCSNAVPPALPNWTANDISFVAPNGVEFMVYTTASQAGNTATYRSDIYVDIDGIAKGKNCSFDATACKNPDRFQFEVSASGKLIASDIKGQEYIATRTSLRAYKDDDVCNSLGLAVAHLGDDDLNRTIERRPFEFKLNQDPPVPVIPPRPEPTPPEPEPEPEPDPDPNPLPPPLIKAKKCEHCGRTYVPGTNCECPGCGWPIICTYDDSNEWQLKY